MSVQRAKDYQYAFSLNKQSAIGTGITPSQINKALPQRGYAQTMLEFPDSVSDKGWYGKGHSFATFQDVIDQLIRVPSREFSLTPVGALHAAAFVLGSLSSTQPSTAAAPTVYDHSFTFQNPTTNPNCLTTSCLEKVGGEYQNLISGLVVNMFQLKADRKDHVTIAWEGFGRKQATNATTMPALTASSFFKILQGDIRLGASGGSYATNISTEVLSMDLKFTQNAKPWFLPGAASQQESLMSKALIGDQLCSGTLVCFIDSARRNLFINRTECELRLTLVGDAIAGGYYNQIQITFPHVKIATEGFSVIDDQIAYTFNFSEETIFKGTSDPYVTVAVRAAIDASELLVSA